MRNRTRTIITRMSSSFTAGSRSFSIQLCSGGSPTTSSVSESALASVSQYGYQETIRDHTGRGIPHAVIHRKMRYGGEFPLLTKTSKTTTGSFGVHTHLGDHPAYLAEYYRRSVIAPIDGWDLTGSLTNDPEGWVLTRPIVDETYIFNNLWEKAQGLNSDILLNLIEANQVWPSIKSFAESLPILARKWRSIRRILKTAPSGYLAWKFGISPIIQDLTNIVRFMPRLAEDYRMYCQRDRVRISQRVVGGVQFTVPSSSDTFNGFKTREWTYQGYCPVAPTTRYVLVLKPNLRYNTELFNKLQYLQQRFTSSPASLAWEKVKLSFVLDWFVDLRGALRALDSALGYSPFTVESYTKSYTYEAVTEAYVQYRSVCNGIDLLPKTKVHERRFKHYERSVLNIPSNWPVWRGHFGKSQALISAALISQKLSSLRAKR